MKIYIVGIGPGNILDMTPRARQAIAESQVIAGYTLYLDLIEELLDCKERIETAMKGEVERCKLAIKSALDGNIVSIVSSGDAGVYGMASIVCELAEPHPNLEIEVIPGITAASAGGAVLGAPLSHDFAVISLSDLLTDWSVIEKRVRYSARADMVICLYNPSSKKRKDYLEKVCAMILEELGCDRVCGIVRNIARDGQTYRLLSLTELMHTPVDMFTTVFIGNSQTKIINGRLVTPRGYLV